MHLLCARSITRRYTAAGVADGIGSGIERVSLALNRGDRLAIVGRSGAGKSTLARCLALLERADTGEVWIDGIDAWRTANLAPLRRMVQLVLQDSEAAFNPRFTAAEAVEEPLRYGPHLSASLRTARARELLDLMHLPRSAADRIARSLSGGERRRVLLARALATSPAALILDETFTSLDGELHAAVSRTLFEVQAEAGFAIVLIGHGLAAARQYQQVAVIDGGEMVESGAVHRVFDHPRSAAGRRFLDAARRLDGAPC